MNENLNVLFESALSNFKDWIDGAKLLGIDLNYKSRLSQSPAISLEGNFKELFTAWNEEYKKNRSLLSLIKKSNAEKCYKAILKSLEEIDKLNNKGNQKGMIVCIKNGIANSEHIPIMINDRKNKLLKTLRKWENLKLTSDKSKESSSIKELIKKLSESKNDPSTERLIKLNDSENKKD